MRTNLRNLKQYFFNLRWEYIHAADDKHIVCPSGQILHTDRCSSTFTRFVKKSCQISGSVTHQRERFFPKAGNDQLSFLTCRKHFPGLRIDHFRYEPVFIDMHTAQFFTLSCNSRTAQFTHSVVLRTKEFLSPYFVHLITHRFCHSFSAEQTDMYFQVFLRVQPPCSYLFSKMQCIRRRCNKQRSSYILHEHNLFFCISGRHWDYRSSKLLQSSVET